MRDAHSPTGEDAGNVRDVCHFSDAEGRHWTVTEEPIPEGEWTSADEETGRSGYAVGWLTFVCGMVRKRLRLFPMQWRCLSDAELERLCRRARTSRACG